MTPDEMDQVMCELMGDEHLQFYSQDLNLMHEAWKTLSKDEHRAWRTNLQIIVQRDEEKVGFRSMSNATSLQREEAFLITKRKWIYKSPCKSCD